MANKKINELVTRTPSLSDLILVGDPSSGYSYKATVTALATIIETDIADGFVTLSTTQTISGAKTFSNNLTLTSVANAATTQTKFLTLNASNVVNYRTGAEVLADIGGQGTLTLTTTGTSGAATLVGNTLNIPQYQSTLTNPVTGTGTTNYLPKFTGSTTIGNSQLIDDGTTVFLGTSGSLPNVKMIISTTSQRALELISTSGNALFVSSGGAFVMTVTNGTWSSQFTQAGRLELGGDLSITTIANATVDTDKFLVSDSGVIKYRTGAEVLSDIGGASSASISGTTNYIPKFTSSSAIGNSVIYESSSKIGIGTTTPTFKLVVSNAGAEGIEFDAGSLVSNKNYIINYNRSTSAYTDLQIDANNIIFSPSGSEGMRLTSTGLGIGTSTNTEAAKLNVQGGYIFLKETGGGDIYFRSGYGGTNPAIQVTSASPLLFLTSNVERMRLDASGNLGLGVTPSAWGSGFKAFEVGQLGSGFFSVGATSLQVTNNYYYNGTNYIYANNGYATRYHLVSGEHQWYNAPSGTAGNAISFTQAMTLDASGRLGIGTSSPNTNSKLTISDGTSISMYWKATNTNAATRDWAIITNNANFGDFAIRQGNSQGADATAGTDRLLISASGNLGLSVTPSAWGSIFTAFEIGRLGDAIFSGSGGGTIVSANAYFGTSNWVYARSAAATNYDLGSGQHRWYIAPSGTAGNAITFTQAMTLDASGRLGIGTTSPSEKLDISGTGDVKAIVQTTSSGSGANTALGVKTAADGNWLIQTGNAISSGLRFYDVTNSAERMRITSAGNVGIGTTSPSNLLSLKASVTAPVLDITRSGGGQGKNSGILFKDQSINEIGAIGTEGQTTNDLQILSTAGIRFNSSSDLISTNERMRITSGGNVGIGSTNPTRLLDVNGVIRTQNAGSAGAPSIELGTSAQGNGLFYPTTNTIAISTNDTERMRITSGGDVAINTTTANSKLHVAGSLRLPLVTKSATYTLDATDYTVGFDCTGANRTANLPDATTCSGRIYVIYQFGGGSTYGVTIDGNSSQTINGSATYVLQGYCDYSSVMIQSDGSNWVVISDALQTGCL